MWWVFHLLICAKIQRILRIGHWRHVLLIFSSLCRVSFRLTTPDHTWRVTLEANLGLPQEIQLTLTLHGSSFQSVERVFPEVQRTLHGNWRKVNNQYHCDSAFSTQNTEIGFPKKISHKNNYLLFTLKFVKNDQVQIPCTFSVNKSYGVPLIKQHI